MRISLSLGPGQHGERLVEVLVAQRMLRSVVRSWPRFQAKEWDETGVPLERSGSTYDRVARLAWAVWRRLPRLSRYETPRGPLSALFDLLARRYVDGCDLFVGWAQVSLRSMRRAKELGAVTLLEHPMSHVDTWMRLAEEEYARWGRADGCYSLFPRILVRRMRKEYQEAAYISVLSSFAKRTFLEAGVPERKLITLALGVDPSLFRPGPPGQELFRILYVGRLELLKGIQYLLQAFSELRLPDAELWMVGPILPEVQSILARHDSGRVRIAGEVPPGEMPAYYRSADVVILPSINDAFGLVILEAMASGLPVIATDHSAASDVIEDKIHGFVVPIRDVGALKDRILYLFDHPEEARAMGVAGRERVLGHFTWDHYAERLLKTYPALVEARQSPIRVNA